MNTKRAAQAGHQSVMKTFDKEGAKSFKQAESTIQRKPNNLATNAFTWSTIGPTHWQRA